jgi:hypothetical protein
MIAGVLAVLAIFLATVGGHADAQISLSPSRGPFLTADQLVTIAEGESAAAQIVSRALEYQLRPFPAESIALIGAQIRENWLPAIPGVRFLRLADDEARASFERCGVFLWVNAFTRVTDSLVVIRIEKGNKCSSFGEELRFNRTKDGWHLDEDGPRSGFGGGGTHCGCPFP